MTKVELGYDLECITNVVRYVICPEVDSSFIFWLFGGMIAWKVLTCWLTESSPLRSHILSFFDVIVLPYIYFFLFSYKLWCVDAVDILSLEVELHNQVDTWKYLYEIICDLKNIYMNT